MLKVRLGNNLENITKVIDENTVIGVFMEENGVDFQNKRYTLNSVPLLGEDYQETFADHGFSDGQVAYLISVVKADNA